MAKIGINQSDILHLAFAVYKEGDKAKLDAAVAAHKEYADKEQALANSIFNALPEAKHIRKMESKLKFELDSNYGGHNKPTRYEIQYHSANVKYESQARVRGVILLTGSQRKRAERFLKNKGELDTAIYEASGDARNWTPRKRGIMTQRIRQRPDLLEKMRAICIEAMGDPPKKPKKPKKARRVR